ncbi:MAG: FAA hydrolase family protein [Ignavibacteriae bacterium]|nr:MAG: FAA hydrolase family protein [Ignavibacteriota bacterium]
MKSVILRGEDKFYSVGKIICLGQNYAEHAREMKFEVPASPVFFFKPPSAIIHNGGQIVLPEISNDVHHEVEMTVLIGEKGSHIHRSAALKHVAGYGIGLDLTMRDIQLEAKKKGLPWSLAKGFDTSAPVSEFIPAETVGDPGSFHVQLLINGNLRQSSSTDKFVFPVDKVISYISQFITFEPGDIIFTGTPEGVSKITHGDKLEASLLDANKNNLVSLSVSVE